MADEPTRPTTSFPAKGSRPSEDARTVTLPMSAILALASFLGGGGVGGVLTSQDVASELREFRVEAKGELEAIRSLIREQGRDVERLRVAGDHREDRLRSLELWRERVEAGRAAQGGAPR